MPIPNNQFLALYRALRSTCDGCVTCEGASKSSFSYPLHSPYLPTNQVPPLQWTIVDHGQSISSERMCGAVVAVVGSVAAAGGEGGGGGGHHWRWRLATPPSPPPTQQPRCRHSSTAPPAPAEAYHQRQQGTPSSISPPPPPVAARSHADPFANLQIQTTPDLSGGGRSWYAIHCTR